MTTIKVSTDNQLRFPEFPVDEKYWFLHSFGEVPYKVGQLTHQIQVHLIALDPDLVQQKPDNFQNILWKGAEKGAFLHPFRRTILIGVAHLVHMRIGSVWHRQRECTDLSELSGEALHVEVRNVEKLSVRPLHGVIEVPQKAYPFFNKDYNAPFVVATNREFVARDAQHPIHHVLFPTTALLSFYFSGSSLFVLIPKK